MGNEWARMDPPSGGIAFTPLPSHPNVPNTYQGNPVKFSSFIQIDPDGYPLFFIVDGSVYDSEGYLIAPALDFNATLDGQYRTNGLLYEGRGELIAYPVPERCGLW